MSTSSLSTADPSTLSAGGLLVAREAIVAARSRCEQPSDGGSTGVSDSND